MDISHIYATDKFVLYFFRMAAYHMLVKWKDQRQSARIQDQQIETELKRAFRESGLEIVVSKINFAETKWTAINEQMEEWSLKRMDTASTEV